MPDLIIKGMEMPKSCDVCPFVGTNDDLMSNDYRYMYCGFPYMGEFVTDYIATRHPDCPLCPAPEWISVEEGLPNDRTPVQLSINRRFQAVARFRDGKWVLSWNLDPLDLEADDVLHWMPLPEPPEGGDGDG